MKAYKIKCNSYWQREEIFNFNGEEWDLDEEILSEGSTAKSAVFESNMQLNMEKVSFKTKKMMISEKGLQLDKRSRDSMILERSHAVDLSGELLQIRVATNRPFLSTKGYGESKSNNSSAKVNSSWSSPTTLKDEIRQLLRWLANKRNSSTFKAEWKDSNVTSNRDNKEQYNLGANYII